MRQIASDDGTFSREANRTPDSMWTEAVKWPRPDPGRPRVRPVQVTATKMLLQKLFLLCLLFWA